MNIRFAYVIFYVESVQSALDFYQRAFGLAPRFIHESGLYGECDTGATTLAFAHQEMAEVNNLQLQFHSLQQKASATEIAFTVDDVDAAYAQALKEGAYAYHPPQRKPWGQRVAYVRDPQGILIEICSVLDPTS